MNSRRTNSIKTAIISTIRDAESVIDSFIDYHLSIGFDRLILFADSPDEPYLKRILKNKSVTVILNSSDKWVETKSYKRYHPFLQKEVMARQILNLELGISMAFDEQIDWVVHLDSDELFYSPSATIEEHFFSLSRDKHETFSYLNYESVVPEMDVRDCFKEILLFKRHLLHLNEYQRMLLENLMQSKPDKMYNFIAYQNGKGSGRISKFLSGGIHGFWTRRWYNLPILNFFSSINLPFFKTRIRKMSMAPSPIILHYPSCGFDSFWKKYVLLGNFDDKWFGEFPISKLVPFHIEARNAVLNGDQLLARDFYQRRVLLDVEDMDFLAHHDIYARIVQPSDIIRRCL